jgi:hypothetical protein
MTESLVQRLTLPKEQLESISGLSKFSSTLAVRINVCMLSITRNFAPNITCLVPSRIITDPSTFINYKGWDLHMDNTVADPTFHVPK